MSNIARIGDKALGVYGLGTIVTGASITYCEGALVAQLGSLIEVNGIIVARVSTASSRLSAENIPVARLGDQTFPQGSIISGAEMTSDLDFFSSISVEFPNIQKRVRIPSTTRPPKSVKKDPKDPKIPPLLPPSTIIDPPVEPPINYYRMNSKQSLCSEIADVTSTKKTFNYRNGTPWDQSHKSTVAVLLPKDCQLNLFSNAGLGAGNEPFNVVVRAGQPPGAYSPRESISYLTNLQYEDFVNRDRIFSVGGGQNSLEMICDIRSFTVKADTWFYFNIFSGLHTRLQSHTINITVITDELKNWCK